MENNSNELNPNFALTIAGKDHHGSRQDAVFNPANGKKLANVLLASIDDLNAAVSAARDALPAWRDTPYAERQRVVASLGGIVTAHRDELVSWLVAEQGKPRVAAEWEIDGAAHWFDGIAKLTLPDEEFDMGGGQMASVRHVPIGVVGAIVPWNFPILLAVWKIAPALLAGNTMVLKPSPHTPLTTLLLGKLAQRVLPPGVLNVIATPDDVAQAMSEHPDIGMIAFTGSTETGKKVLRSAAGTLKRTGLELGGNDAAIVLPDVDIATAAPALFWAAFQNSGQFCVATKRLYVHEDIYDAFLDAFVAYAKSIKMGDGSDPETHLGPLQNALQYRKVRELIEDTKSAGHRFALGGEVDDGDGFFIPVTIVDNPPDNSRCVQEEAFGPVLPLLKYRNVDEVVARANATHYGLGASVWGTDVEQALEIARRLEAGVVWINQIHILGPQVPMGGIKQSGLGVENGVAGVTHYCNTQTTLLHRPG